MLELESSMPAGSPMALELSGIGPPFYGRFAEVPELGKFPRGIDSFPDHIGTFEPEKRMAEMIG
jgi:hypothetical protein